MNARAVRERAERMLEIGLDDNLPHFRVDLDSLPAAVDLVVKLTRQRYPSLDMPFHSRWRHFVFGGKNRWGDIDQATAWPDQSSRARAAFDLAIVSVLLDAGAGPQWRYRDPDTGQQIGRSEGLGLASLSMFAGGAFSSDRNSPLQADGQRLAQISQADIGRGLQVAPANPLVGIAGRADLLKSLGALVTARPDIFARNDVARPGGFFDHLMTLANDGAISAPTVLAELLRHFGPIWPSRLTLGGISLGDCWRHAAIARPDATNGLVPLHKLSQWLTYSLIEPLQWAGLAVTDIDGLTGLAEYRNGGLFVDTGVLAFRHSADAVEEHEIASPLVVEWRALTVALLDKLAEAMRRQLGMNETKLPLAKVLEGGTWEAGRVIARQLRSDGSPPVKIISDGTVF
ncbi:MAG: URC4/urg3 family protein [Xanthobacteraceae bacterium]